VWSGALSFGLVNVPVRMVTATVNRDVSFNQLEASTGSRIRLRRISEATGEEVSNDALVKGYEIAKGQYVVIEPEELEAIRPKSTHTIEIEEFVPLAEIDPVYFEHPYYLVPDKQGAKAYRLLVEAMEGLQKVALGRVVIRQRESLVAIRVREGLLCLQMMRYADELVDLADVAPDVADDAEPSEREVAMARQLVDALTNDFEPEKFHNEYREKVLELIEQKASGAEIVAAPKAEPAAKVLDLMAALEASIATAGQGATDAGPTRTRAASRAGAAGVEAAEADAAEAEAEAEADKPARKRAPRTRTA
jgi:DNA end-binding protein Ku